LRLPFALSRPTHLVQRQLLAGAAAAGSGAARPSSHKAVADARGLGGDASERGEVPRLVARVDSLPRRVSADWHGLAGHALEGRQLPLAAPPLTLAAPARLLPPEPPPHTKFQADHEGQGQGPGARGDGGEGGRERGGPEWSASIWEFGDRGGQELVVAERQAAQDAAAEVRR
jgi:hypothetical protein